MSTVLDQERMKLFGDFQFDFFPQYFDRVWVDMGHGGEPRSTVDSPPAHVISGLRGGGWCSPLAAILRGLLLLFTLNYVGE